MRFRVSRFLALTLLLLVPATAHAVIMKLTPLAEILENDDYIFLATIDKLEPEKPLAVFKVEKVFRGKPPYERIAVNMTGNDEAKKAGDQAAVTKWTQAAQSLAMKLQASENNVNSLKEQYEFAVGQAEEAKEAVQTNAMSLQELSARRMEMLGSLEQAKMQETVNSAVEAMSRGVTDDMPSLDQVETKIEQRKAEAMAKAELREATPEGAEAELRKAINTTEADAKLDELRAELGLQS